MGFWDYVGIGLGLSEQTKEKPSKPKKKTKCKIVICEPKDFCDIVHFVGKLRENKPVIVNFSRLESNVERGLDFVCGAVCALNGRLQRIKEGLYFYAPSNLEIENLSSKR